MEVKIGDKFTNEPDRFYPSDRGIIYYFIEAFIWDVTSTNPRIVLEHNWYKMSYTPQEFQNQLKYGGIKPALAPDENQLLPQTKTSSCPHTRKALYISPNGPSNNYYYCKDCEEKIK